MASKCEYTVKIPCATQNPWMSYNEVLEFILTHPPDSLIVNYSDRLLLKSVTSTAMGTKQNSLKKGNSQSKYV